MPVTCPHGTPFGGLSLSVAGLDSARHTLSRMDIVRRRPTPTRPARRRRRGGTLAALLAVIVLAIASACSSSSPDPTPTGPTPAQRLATAKAQLDAATSVHLSLTSADLPSGVSGIVSADGWGAHPPAFKGTFQVTVRGTAADTQVVAVGGEVYAKLPFVPIFAKVDPATLGAPDPATLFDPTSGVTSLLTATVAPTAAEPVRKGSEVLRVVSGTLPGKAIVDLLKVGDPNATFTVSYGLTEPGGQLRSVELRGPFYGATPSTYRLTFDRYGEPVEIVKP
ncbi:MAG: LppX_LprAFG lipoprotein [Dermatophilaceae bacterium]